MSLASVSVVVPVFNREDLVADSIRSVQRQAGVEVEVIVVDDGSTDATPEVLAKLERADSRVRVLRIAHAGPAAARNAGVAVARGEYLTFLDSDDLCPAGRLGRQVEKLASREDVTAVIGAVLFFEALDPGGGPRRDPRHVPFHNATLQSATLRTRDFLSLGPLDETLGFAEDVDFFLRLLEADFRLLLESEIACFYRHHPGNMTRDLRGRQQGYARAYARSIARRRAAGRTRPIERFFPRQFERDTVFGGGHALQPLRPTPEPAALASHVNAFYLRYWRDLTDLESLAVRLEVSGHGSVRLHHRRPDGARTVIREVALPGPRRTLSLEVELGDPAEDGVIEVDLDPGVTVHAGSWVTFDEPRQEVQLAIVVCSFNAPRAVAESLARLHGAPARVIVVHQGDAELRVPAGVEMVRQPNFGGSGGFARGILEALEGGATHVLLLDDDVRLDPDLVGRLRPLLARLTRPATIGGQMLDLSRPTVLGASHETVDLPRMRLRNPLGGVDLAGRDAVAVFARRHVSDYNGWWCCCMPAQTARAALPLPMFIRHDDVEHGLRSTRLGSEVVTMPGLFVWHKPFDAKIKLWYTYYDRRNKLIVAALHGALPGRALARLFLADCWDALTLHRYDICWAACRAARDFLAGPALVFSDPRTRHEEIVAGVARYALRTVQGNRARGGRPMGLLRSLRLPYVARAVGEIAREMAGCGWGLLRRGARVSAEYRRTREWYSSPDYWRAYLGLDA